MKIFEGEAPFGAARRQLGLKLDLDLAEALFHLLDVWKLARNQLGRERMAIDSERQIAEHLGGVLAIWGVAVCATALSENEFRIAVHWVAFMCNSSPFPVWRKAAEIWPRLLI